MGMIVVLVYTAETCLPGNCRNIQFEPYTMDKILENYVIRTVTVKSNEICEVYCYEEPNCFSYNCGPGDSENKQCDLNSRSYGQASNADFITKEGYIYRNVLVSEESNFGKTIVPVSIHTQGSGCFPGYHYSLHLLTDIIFVEPLRK